MMSATPTSSAGMAWALAMLRNDLPAAASSAPSTTSTGSAGSQSFRSPTAWAVEGASKAPASNTASDERSACSDRAERSAARRSLRLTLKVKLRGLGPKVTPPPVHRGERFEPARARPVPFWRQGFSPPPRTSPRVLVDAVPRRRAASSARTLPWTSGMLKRAVKAPASSVTLPPPSLGALGAAGLRALGIGADLHGAAFGPGHGAADEQQVPVRHDLNHGQPTLGDPAAAHPAGAADSLEHA